MTTMNAQQAIALTDLLQRYYNRWGIRQVTIDGDVERDLTVSINVDNEISTFTITLNGSIHMSEGDRRKGTYAAPGDEDGRE